MTPVRLEPAASGSRVKHSITEPLKKKVIETDHEYILFSESSVSQINFEFGEYFKKLKFESSRLYCILLIFSNAHAYNMLVLIM